MFVKRSSLLAAGLALVAAAFAPEAAAQTCPSVSVAVDAPPIVKRGGNFFYKLTVTNHGQGTVSGFEVAVNTPALTTVRKSPWRKAPTTVGNGPLGTVVQVPSLASGKSVTLSLRLGVDKCAPEVLTVGALGRLTGSLDCSTPVPDAVLEVKGDNSKCANIQPSPLPGDLTLAQIAALYNTPQGTSLPSYVATGTFYVTFFLKNQKWTRKMMDWPPPCYDRHHLHGQVRAVRLRRLPHRLHRHEPAPGRVRLVSKYLNRGGVCGFE